MNYQGALEFIGEVRAGISWERFCLCAVRHADDLISMLSESPESQAFLSSREISSSYVHDQAKAILIRLHFNPENDHYLALGLSRSASEAEINRRWKDLMLIYHPDRSSDEEATRSAMRINEAYNILKSPEKRAEYDRKRPDVIQRNTYHSNGFPQRSLRRSSFGTDRMRSIFPGIIIPSCIGIAVAVLIFLFFDNRRSAFSPDDLLQPPQVKGERKQTDEKAAIEAEKSVLPAAPAPSGERIRNLTLPGPAQTSHHEYKESPAMKIPGAESKKTERGGEEIPSIPLRPIETPRPVYTEEMKSTGHTDERASAPEEQFSVARKVRETPVVQNQPVVAVRETPHGELGSEAYLFLLQFISAYEKGDIEKFMALLSQDVVENGIHRYEDMRKLYKKNFETNQYRYTVREVKIEARGDGAFISGMYQRDSISGSEKGSSTGGKITWALRNVDGSLKLVKMDYERK